MRKYLLLISKVFTCLGFILVVTACEETETGPASEADFTYEADENDPMLIHFTNSSQNYHASYWQFGDGSDFSTEDSPSHTYPGGGIYTVTLAVQGQGTGQEIRREIEVIDPSLQGERVNDGNFEDEDAWTVYSAGYDILTDVEFANGTLVFSNGVEIVDTNIVIWQAIEVEAGKEYVFSADVRGGGMHQAWLEFHLSDEEPEEGDDYGANNLFSMNTWAECGAEPFDGNIVEIGCAGDGESDGIVTFETGGTHYLVIKAGSWEGTLGAEGIAISNVSLMPADEVE